MKINGKPTRTSGLKPDGWSVEIIDQTRLPHALETVALKTADDAAYAIKAMQVRGAPLIGVTAAYGVALAMRKIASRRGARRRDRVPGEPAPDGGQPALGAGGDAPHAAAPRPAMSARAAAYKHAAKHCRRRCRDVPPHRRCMGVELIKEISQPRRAARRSTS